MTSKEFVLWLKGFTEGVHEFNITPKQWDTLKEKLAEVDDNTIPMGGLIVDHNRFKVNDPGFYQTPNPYTINCGSGKSGTTITTTPNVGGTIIATPGYGSITYNPSTSTAYGYPSGSAWSYTNSTYNPPYTTGGEADNIKKEPHNED
jgi:hypothetical protein